MADDTPTVEAVTAMLRETQVEMATIKREQRADVARWNKANTEAQELIASLTGQLDAAEQHVKILQEQRAEQETPAMADDTTRKLTPVAWSKERGFYWSPDGAYYRREDVDALIAAVRAEPRLTVVKLRDDEASPVAAPCALAGACQYREGFAKMLFNPPTE